MKKYVRNAIDTLLALDCHLDHEDRKLRTDRWIFTHANAPDERFTLNLDSSETRCRVVVQRAKIAAGLATSVSTEKPKPKVNQREKRERADRIRRAATARRLAQAKKAEEKARRDAALVARRRHELDSLMRGRPSGVDSDAVAADAMLTVEQAADLTGVADKVLRRAIDSDSLNAYMCSGVIKVKGADLRVWLRAAS